MKNYLFGLFSLAVLASSLLSCNEDIELIGDFEETAIVYSLIDQSDSIHFVKITRAYIGPGNSLQYAQVADSSYFPNVTATVTEVVNGVEGRKWTLLDTIVLNKSEDGVFYAPEQKLYAFYTHGMDNSNSPTGASLLDNAIYKINIDINNGDFQVEGQTEIVSGISTNKDGMSPKYQFAEGSSTTGEYKSSSVTVNTNNAKIVNTSLQLEYEEFFNGSSIGFQNVSWVLGEKEVDNPSISNSETFVSSGVTFYNLIAARCAASTDQVDKRNMNSITVKVVGGTEELYNYILVNEPSSSLAQSKPTYTNLTATDGHEVVGLFSSRLTHTYTIPMVAPSQFVRCIDRNSTFELCSGPITGPYNFCSQHSLDIAGGYPYICN